MNPTLRISLLLVGLAAVCQAQITRFQHIIVVFLKTAHRITCSTLCATAIPAARRQTTRSTTFKPGNGWTGLPLPAFIHPLPRLSPMATASITATAGGSTNAIRRTRRSCSPAKCRALCRRPVVSWMALHARVLITAPTFM